MTKHFEIINQKQSLENALESKLAKENTMKQRRASLVAQYQSLKVKLENSHTVYLQQASKCESSLYDETARMSLIQKADYKEKIELLEGSIKRHTEKVAELQMYTTYEKNKFQLVRSLAINALFLGSYAYYWMRQETASAEESKSSADLKEHHQVVLELRGKLSAMEKDFNESQAFLQEYYANKKAPSSNETLEKIQKELEEAKKNIEIYKDALQKERSILESGRKYLP